MGFGTLFFGYFLLLNITYFSFTDIISALIMAMSFNKLSSVNRFFRGGFILSLIFAACGAFELCVQIYAMFMPTFDITSLMSYVSISRYLIIAVTTVFMLLGIENVSYEVGLSELAKKTRLKLFLTFIVYAVATILEIPMLEIIIDIKILAVASVITLFAILITVCANLFTVYSAYSKICMPEDKDNDIINKPSKFGFVNKFREHSEEKRREYAEYRMEKFKKKQEKNNNKKKK